jgi:hypothetical protein
MRADGGCSEREREKSSKRELRKKRTPLK